MLGLLKKLPKSLYIILTLSLIIHIICLVKQPGVDAELIKKTYGANDAYNYTLSAQQLLEHGVFGYVYMEPSDPPQKNAYVTPGQPLLLTGALIISKITSIPYYYVGTGFNTIFDLLTILLLYLIGKELFERKSYGLIASGLYASYFSMYHYFRTLLTEPPSMFLLCFSVYLFVLAWKYNKVKFHVWFGIVVSILLMFRPNPAPMLLIPMIVVIYSYGIKESIKIGLLWCIGPIFIIGAWVFRNFLALNQFVLFSTQGGDPLIAGADPFNKTGYINIVNDMNAAGYTDKSEYAKHLIKQGFSTDFTYWFSWFTVGKTIELFIRPSWVGNYSFSLFVKKYHQLLMAFTALSSFCFMLNSFKHKRFMMLVSSVIVYVASTNIFLAIDRYGYFIIPLICLIASYGIVRIIQALSNLKYR
ncbi:4-amino-4-deoxy-L-arabinose transferase [Bacillus pseudomycoides]|uniref:4-amino-4-deoxy-L-arabinose transferase n=1 Tax=Bacillus pseudomycoides TaxID=64104 RepID=A0ABD6TCG2_9BACI|nr:MULTISPECIES: glycosyltransferase family 39 protein [Bacillus]MCX2828952.1 glycosyltransferase family 39 protein [Bacillus sp. DHT2]MDR4917009.1 glycosyltransferase family 39 protein [Bacillus pseudomycoides]PDY01842.1 4-amino-4-deoxy-L-arabinose transferase [Bacillus pseudomycoides]PDZ12498.1 4-amino-4-deoxy-L-arabinose transferase [Bacillus pseudomycoides]PEK36270.1 4-amino-4-deoxy-L-arabinose transferase [Bacillus pseudomycoides]